MIADRDEVIAVAGGSKQFMGKSLSSDVERRSRTPHFGHQRRGLSIVDDYSVPMWSSPRYPRRGPGGYVMLLSGQGGFFLEQKLCETAADFLSKQLG